MTARERWKLRCWRLRVAKLRLQFTSFKGDTIYIPSTEEALQKVKSQ